jgi:predicted Zn-dependent protease
MSQMSRAIDPAQVHGALEAFGPGTTLDITDEQTELMRYAESRVIAQHSERRTRARVRINRDGRVAMGTLETLDPAAVRALAERLSDALTVLASGVESVKPPRRTDATAPVNCPPASEACLSSTPAVRHAWFSTVRDGLGSAAELGGSIRNEVIERIVADDEGLYRSEVLTKASLQAVAEQGERSASVRTVHRDAAQINVEPVAGALRSALAPLPTREKFSGTPRVLLRPEAANALISTYGYAALGAAGYAQGRTAVAGRLGSKVASDVITLTDDGSDPAGLPSGFDPEGTPRRRTRLIEKGSLVGVVSDLERAEVTDGLSTGHAVPIGWRFGADPVPSHLLLEPGTATDDELLAGLGTGLVINRLDYLRVLHPKDTLVTGTTRDATYWAEDGKIVAWHPSVRLTFRMDEVLNAVLAVGAERERGEAVFMESVVAPALLIDAGPFRV